MPEKRDHVILRRLIKIADCRLPFSSQVRQLRLQRQWLIDLEHLLDPAEPSQPRPLTSQSVSQAVDEYLNKLLAQVSTGLDETDRLIATHINQTFRDRWWGLFTCYDVDGLPRTNNELERYMRRIKSGYRRISGRKNVHAAIIRYGPYAACVDYQESLGQLLARLQQVSQDDFNRQRQTLEVTFLREQKRHRFRHRQDHYLRQLEDRWAAALEKTAL